MLFFSFLLRYWIDNNVFLIFAVVLVVLASIGRSSDLLAEIEEVGTRGVQNNFTWLARS